MRISDKGLKFIARYETGDGKPNLKAVKSPEQPDPSKVKYEIGFGHNSDSYYPVSADSVITESEAYEILAYDVGEAERLVNNFIAANHLTFTQNEYDALVSAVFNGVPLYSLKYGLSRALKKYSNPDFIGDGAEVVAKEWKKWVYMTVGGKKVVAKGLVRRRADELDLFFKGDYERD